MPGLYASDRWQVRAQNPEAARFLKDAYGLEGLVARVLAARGITDPEQVETYLSPSLARDWHDPSDIPGLEAVAQRVEQAIVAGESIAVFGDFDVDGMSSASLLCLALREFGARVHAVIPHRFGEGYGLSEQGMARVIQQCDPSLVVTVDNGISSAAEVDYVRSLGIDVAVTDHHEPGAQVPQGVPVADPKLDPHNYSRDLAGVGVALKLVQAVGRRVGQPELWRNYLDLASLGTVSDMMELTRENRALVTEGIAQMRQGLRPGLVALARTARTDIARINADNLPFSLVPRLNAAGRMGQEDVAFNLLLTSDPVEAEALASELESINASRRSIESDMAAEAFAQAEEVWCWPTRGGMKASRAWSPVAWPTATRYPRCFSPSKTALPLALAALWAKWTCSTLWSPAPIYCCALVVIPRRWASLWRQTSFPSSKSASPRGSIRWTLRSSCRWTRLPAPCA